MRFKWKEKPHRSHRMTKARTDILSPCDTPRFYTVRECKNCEGKQAEGVAGQFIDKALKKKCEVAP